MDPYSIIYTLIVLIAWIGGSHTSIRRSRVSAQAYDDLLAQVGALHKQYGELVEENMILKADLSTARAQREAVINEYARISGEISALREKHEAVLMELADCKDD